MSQPVSIVMPTLFDRGLFDRSLPALFAERNRRGLADEILLVDDTGEGVVKPWIDHHYPGIRVLSRSANGGYAKALFDGVEAAKHELVFTMNPDVVVHGGFLEPLVEALEDPEVHSAVPRILLHGEPERIESVTEVRIRDGLGEVGQPGLEGRAEEFQSERIPVAYAIGGACLMRRTPFLENGCDPLFQPFYWEDVDLGWRAWRDGKRVLYVPDSVVEHHHRGTIKTRVQDAMVRAAIEKNRLLFQWKYLDTERSIQEHLTALYRWAVDAWLRDEREELIWLALAMDQVEEARRSRSALPPAKRSFEEIRSASSVVED